MYVFVIYVDNSITETAQCRSRKNFKPEVIIMSKNKQSKPGTKHKPESSGDEHCSDCHDEQ